MSVHAVRSLLAAAAPSPRPWRPGWLREPLLHFVVLGGLLFALDHFLIGRPTTRTRSSSAPTSTAKRCETFKAARGREPNAEELEALRRVWLDNEVLYREGLALQVDKGDTAIRERVIFKALSVIDSNVKLPPVDDKVLREWFEAHRDKYDEPRALRLRGGRALRRQLRGRRARLRHGARTAARRATPRPGCASSRAGRTRTWLRATARSSPRRWKACQSGQWQALHTRDGWRAMRLDAITPPKPAVFEALRGVVLHDWTDATAAEQRTAAVRALAKKYKVKYETSTR